MMAGTVRPPARADPASNRIADDRAPAAKDRRLRSTGVGAAPTMTVDRIGSLARYGIPRSRERTDAVTVEHTRFAPYPQPVAVDVVVVSYNSRSQLRASVAPLAGRDGIHVIVVDSASS